jgi:hypothetical protein
VNTALTLNKPFPAKILQQAIDQGRTDFASMLVDVWQGVEAKSPELAVNANEFNHATARYKDAVGILPLEAEAVEIGERIDEATGFKQLVEHKFSVFPPKDMYEMNQQRQIIEGVS